MTIVLKKGSNIATMDIIIIIVVVAIALIFIQLSVSENYVSGNNILYNYSDQTVGRHLITCKHKCGSDTPACSCRVKCRILGNCCEDFLHQCREEYNNTERIKHLFHSKVACYKSTLMVVNLPDQELVTGSTQFSSSSMASTQVSTDGYDMFKYLLNQMYYFVPVTDLFSGIIFIKKDVFDYYSVEQSQPVYWVVVVKMSHWEPQIGMEDIWKYADMAYINYLPPKTDNSSAPFPCFGNAVKKCKNTSDLHIVEKCNSFVTYIAKESGKYYRNIYCRMCETKKTLTIDHRYQLKFPKEVELQMSGILLFIKKPDIRHFIFDVMKVLKHGDAHILQQINCVDVNMKATVLSCTSTVYNCPGDLVLTPMNTCRYWGRLRIALGAVDNSRFGDDFDRFLLKLSSIFWCLLQSWSDSAFIDQDQLGVQIPYQFYHREMDAYVYMFERNVWWPRKEYNQHIPTFSMAIDIATKALLQYLQGDADSEKRGQTDGEIDSKTDNVNDQAGTGIYKDDNIISFSLKHNESNMKFSSEISSNNKWYSKESIADSNPIVRACVCYENQKSTMHCTMYCWTTPTFKREQTKIQKALSSHCFRSDSCSYCQCKNYYLAITLCWVLFYMKKTMKQK